MLALRLGMANEPIETVTFIEQEASGDTSLDPDEINILQVPTAACWGADDAELELCQAFRHGFWKARRQRTFDVLSNCGKTRNELDRFANCGAASWLFHHPGPPEKWKIGTSKCRNRWCEACAREKRHLICRNLRTYAASKALRLLTLTLAGSDNSLDVQIERLYAGWKDLRASNELNGLIRGGVAFLEITRGKLGDHWHPHLHIIYEGKYLPQKVVSKLWKKITGDSWIVDLRFIGNAESAASYVAKYASKSIPKIVWDSPEQFAEVIHTFNGRRTFNTFGTWRKFPLTKPPKPDEGWERICPLFWAMRVAKLGSTEVGQLLNSLYQHAETFDLIVVDNSS
jgi:hypothetical protein